MSARTYAWRFLIVGDVRFYARQRRFIAMLRAIWLRLWFGWDAEACQVCGRRYFWSNWVASSELYERVHGSGRGTLCPRHFSEEASVRGIKIAWVPIEETDIETHGRIMDGQLTITKGAPHD